jgi:hypothetical protein
MSAWMTTVSKIKTEKGCSLKEAMKEAKAQYRASLSEEQKARLEARDKRLAKASEVKQEAVEVKEEVKQAVASVPEVEAKKKVSVKKAQKTSQ